MRGATLRRQLPRNKDRLTTPRSASGMLHHPGWLQSWGLQPTPADVLSLCFPDLSFQTAWIRLQSHEPACSIHAVGLPGSKSHSAQCRWLLSRHTQARSGARVSVSKARPGKEVRQSITGLCQQPRVPLMEWALGHGSSRHPRSAGWPRRRRSPSGLPESPILGVVSTQEPVAPRPMGLTPR